MEIAEIKQRLDIVEVAEHLGIRVDAKSHKAICPFHNDTKPSLQFSRERQICTCFSSNCDAGTMDVVGLTEKYLKTTKHEALKYLAKLAGEVKEPAKKSNAEQPDYVADFGRMQSSIIASTNCREYAESRKLDWKALGLGYNAYRQGRAKYLRGCLVFPLRDEGGKVVSLYGRSIRDNDRSRHYYTKDRKGLYPKYPEPNTERLILCESVLDCATLLSAKVEVPLLALYGTNGLTAEHAKAIGQLESLSEIILFFDGDGAGRSAVERQGRFLADLVNAKLSYVETPENEDINSLAQSHEEGVFGHLIANRKPLPVGPLSNFSFSSEEAKPTEKAEETQRVFNTENPHRIHYLTQTAGYWVKGGIRNELDSMKVSLDIENMETARKSRHKLDLYEDRQSAKVAREASEKLGLEHESVICDLSLLTDLLDEYREGRMDRDSKNVKSVEIPESMKSDCLSFLKEPKLLERINAMIGRSGVVGEELARLFLFVIASSYKMEDTLHALIQGSSGSGKTHLLATIMDFMPPEDTISLTRVTESSFYNYGKHELSNKLIGLEDYDGMEERAELAFRELQSKGMIASSTSGKNEHTGEIASFVREVFGPIASLSATTRGEIYEDNMSRCFLVAVDESQEQTLRIIKYQNEKSAGKINKSEEKNAREFLRNCMRLLKPYEVVNPYADRMELPKEAHKIRRLNGLFQSYVRQITLLNQYQRKRDRQGRLITAKSDVRDAVAIMFESIVLKVDELDGSLRSFYERLKKHLKDQRAEFTQREIRHALKISKTQLQRHINQLEELEYIQRKGYGTHGAVKYAIAYWDDSERLRRNIRKGLDEQLDRL